jgi:hypothetical protein
MGAQRIFPNHCGAITVHFFAVPSVVELIVPPQQRAGAMNQAAMVAVQGVDSLSELHLDG